MLLRLLRSVDLWIAVARSSLSMLRSQPKPAAPARPAVKKVVSVPAATPAATPLEGLPVQSGASGVLVGVAALIAIAGAIVAGGKKGGDGADETVVVSGKAGQVRPEGHEFDSHTTRTHTHAHTHTRVCKYNPNAFTHRHTHRHTRNIYIYPIYADTYFLSALTAIGRRQPSRPWCRL